MAGDRVFLIGETVEIVAKINKPGSKTPDNPASVVLAALRRAGATLPEAVADPAFARVSDGLYLFSLATDDLLAGTYTYLVRASDEATKVVLAEDTFVLKAPTAA